MLHIIHLARMCVLSREPQSFYKESLLGKVTPSFKHQYYVNLIQIWGALSPSGQTQYASGRDPISKACMLSWQLPPCPELLRSSCSSLALCSIFLFFWFLPHFVLLITVDGMATAFFFSRCLIYSFTIMLLSGKITPFSLATSIFSPLPIFAIIIPLWFPS